MAKSIKAIADIEIPDRGKAIVFPLKHEGYGTVWDAKKNHVLDIRGWGRLQYHPNGHELQDGIADWMVATLNEAYKKENA